MKSQLLSSAPNLPLQFHLLSFSSYLSGAKIMSTLDSLMLLRNGIHLGVYLYTFSTCSLHAAPVGHILYLLQCLKKGPRFVPYPQSILECSTFNIWYMIIWESIIIVHLFTSSFFPFSELIEVYSHILIILVPKIS